MLFSTVCSYGFSLQNHVTPEIPKIFDAVFEVTLSMINKDFQEFPEHRTHFYSLLQQVVSNCFSALLAIPAPQFKLVLTSIIWAIKHTMRDVADTGLAILTKLLENITREETAMQSFFQTFYTEIMEHLFAVATDTSHAAGLTQQASLLAYLFSLVESGKISVPLDPSVVNIPGDNIVYVQGYVANLLKSAFSHLTEAQIKLTVQGFFSLNQQPGPFREHLRDFLVQIKVCLVLVLYSLCFTIVFILQEFVGEDNADLFVEEREAELKKAEADKRAYNMTVPGILNPHEREEEMQE